MKTDNNTQFIESVKIGDHLVNVYLDDAGQSYILEYLDSKTKEIKEVGCGTYNSDYQYVIEEILGNPLECPHYPLTKAKNETCEYKNQFGYCYKCFFYDVENSMLNNLVKAGFVDRRLQINPKYKKLFAEIVKAQEFNIDYVDMQVKED